MNEETLRRSLYEEMLTAMQGLPPWIAEPPNMQLGERNVALINALADFSADTILQVASPGSEHTDIIVEHFCNRVMRRVISARCVGRG